MSRVAPFGSNPAVVRSDAMRPAPNDGHAPKGSLVQPWRQSVSPTAVRTCSLSPAAFPAGGLALEADSVAHLPDHGAGPDVPTLSDPMPRSNRGRC